MECWASDRCSYRGQRCRVDCDGYQLLKALYDQANMPKKYQTARLSGLEVTKENAEAIDIVKRYIDNVVETVKKGKGIFFYSGASKINPLGTGTGKTTLACAIMNEYFLKVAWVAKLEPMGVFVSVSDLLERIKGSFDENDPELDEIIENLRVVPLVILDDLGVEKPTEWTQLKLYNLLNHRDTNGLATIVTSNYPIETIAERLGYRVASRISSMCYPLALSGKDYRRGEPW